MKNRLRWMASLTMVAALITGCEQSEPAPKAAAPQAAVQENQEQVGAVASTGGSGHDHSGWWCGEHGVPEEVCGLCNSKLAAEFQKKGDWCRDHDRPDSQCFKCHPELEAKFAAQYEARYGRKPPTPEG